MKKLVFLTLLFVSNSVLALEYNIQGKDTIPGFREEVQYVVESEYSHLFKRESFESKVKEILKVLDKHKSEKPFKYNLGNHNQSIFIERYFKINYPDAYISHKAELIVYPKKKIIGN